MNIEILGPFDFLPFQQNSKTLYTQENSWKPGIYFWVYKIGDTNFINYIGITSNSIAQRQSGHLSSFLTGTYDIYNTDSLFSGVLERVYTSANGFDSFLNCQKHLELQLNSLKFYYSPIDAESSILKRIETALISHIRSNKEFSTILDNGSVSRYRREDETEIYVTINSEASIKGLPREITV
jgi:hypothetical protein